MATLTFRDALPTDYALFVRLVAELAVDDDPGDEERFAREIAPTTVFAEHDGQPVGYAHYRVMGSAGRAPSVHLGHLVSAPEARRTGVGRALIEETVRRAKLLGATEVALNVRPENTPALTLYQSSGFEERETVAQLRLTWHAMGPLTAAERALGQRAQPVAPGAEVDLESAFDLPRGLLGLQRRRGYLILAIDDRALAAFDPTVPGTYPFRAADGEHARALLAALAPHALPDKPFVNVSPGANGEVVDALVELGAVVRFRTTRMVRPLVSGS